MLGPACWLHEKRPLLTSVAHACLCKICVTDKSAPVCLLLGELGGCLPSDALLTSLSSS